MNGGKLRQDIARQNISHILRSKTHPHTSHSNQAIRSITAGHTAVKPFIKICFFVLQPVTFLFLCREVDLELCKEILQCKARIHMMIYANRTVRIAGHIKHVPIKQRRRDYRIVMELIRFHKQRDRWLIAKAPHFTGRPTQVFSVIAIELHKLLKKVFADFSVRTNLYLQLRKRNFHLSIGGIRHLPKVQSEPNTIFAAGISCIKLNSSVPDG